MKSSSFTVEVKSQRKVYRLTACAAGLVRVGDRLARLSDLVAVSDLAGSSDDFHDVDIVIFDAPTDPPSFNDMSWGDFADYAEELRQADRPA